jgi:hypothetical protein
MTTKHFTYTQNAGKVVSLFQHKNTQNTKGKIMNAFLPQDYEAPTTAGNYMKLQPGENKIRILSAPLLGWEDWTIEKKPVRFSYDQKPARPIVSDRPIKHFWAVIVWNYKEEKIQILQITQSSIRASIQALCENEDWGAPYFYDIKITKKGEKVDTEYNVAPSPHKSTNEVIRNAFVNKPCNLDALLSGKDPFADIQDGFTSGIFEDSNIPTEISAPTLSVAQVSIIINLAGQDKDLLDRIKDGYKVEALSQIPQQHFDVIQKNLISRKGVAK